MNTVDPDVTTECAACGSPADEGCGLLGRAYCGSCHARFSVEFAEDMASDALAGES